jgi:hypothetical protein
MFRKDPATIGEWSLQQVEKCWQLQRDIVREAWHCLNDGGILIYSTCTFNLKENEENIRWMTEELGAEVLPVTTKPEWHITGSLLEGFNAPVYRFIPGITRGEGLFMAILRKGDGSHSNKSSHSNYNNHCNDSSPITPTAPLTYQEAISYLRREALHLSDDIPRGVVTVTFQGFPLGQVKNIGSRANNLYPKEWRIKTTHTPTEYEPILRKK